MNRRNFLRSMLGVAAATALPSEVFPFRKIFLPPARFWAGTSILRPTLDEVANIEFEIFAKEIPDLFFRSTSMYELLKKKERIAVSVGPLRIPFHYEAVDKNNSGDVACAETATKILSYLETTQV